MIQTQKISDHTYGFQFQKPISEDEFFIESAQKSAASPLAKKLFGFPWIESLKVLPQAIELTKKDWVDWEILLEPLTGLLEEHIANQMTLEKSPLMSVQNLDGDQALLIKNFITESINPSLSMHGGWIELKSFEKDTAYLVMGGGCQGCASSQATMIDGVETALKENFSFVSRVIDVTDHASGANPFYS